MKNIGKDQFLGLTLRLPPLAEQVRIADMLASMDAVALNYRKQSQLLTLEKQALARELMIKCTGTRAKAQTV